MDIQEMEYDHANRIYPAEDRI